MTRKGSGVIFDETGVTINPDGAALTLVLFYHAGGSALSLVPLVKDLPEHIRARIVELPGRGIRSTERPAERFDAALADCLARTREFTAGPHVLFGHSLGSALAHEVALHGEASGKAPRRVILSASSLLFRGGSAHPARRTRDDLIAALHRHGGTPDEVFASPRLLDTALTTLGRDMLLADSYRPTTASTNRTTPYSIWYGSSDATVPPLPAEAWTGRLGTLDVEVELFAGGHFYLAQSTQAERLLHDIAHTEAARRHEHA